MLYEVIVGNIDTVYSGDDAGLASAKYDRYCEMADISQGSRCYGETVTIMIDGEMWKEHTGIRDAD
jgi:hypothetical protein